MSDHLAFAEIRDTGKTKVWTVTRADNGVWLGEVRWWGAWRKYVFAPASSTIFDTKCMADISAFITEQMTERTGR